MQEMDTKGIGTDATIATHIKTVVERCYARRNEQQRFEPTALGLALVEGYEAIGFAMTTVGWVRRGKNQRGEGFLDLDWW